VDAATAGIDVAPAMRSVPQVIVVDACRSGSMPGTLIELRGAEVEQLPPPSGISVHALRWDHALAFARWRLAEAYPAEVTVLLIEGERFEYGEPLSPAVEEAVEGVCRRILEDLLGVAAATTAHPTASAAAASPSPLSGDGERWPAPGWHVGPAVMAVMAVTDGQPIPFMAGDVPGIVVRGTGGLRAFRSRCAHAGLSLDTASIDRGSDALVCRWHAYRFDIDTGGGLTAPHRCLEVWPCRVVDGLIWVRPTVTAGCEQDSETSAQPAPAPPPRPG
jgi:hydrogenase maturation protease